MTTALTCFSRNEQKDNLEMIQKKSRLNNLAKITVVLILVANFKLTNCNVNTTSEFNDDDDGFSKRLNMIENVVGRSFSDVYKNGTFRTGNMLWDNILNKCTVHPSVSCLQSNFYSYLDEKLDYSGDINFGSGVCFKKNNVDINKYSKEANVIYLTGSKDEEKAKSRSLDEENKINDEESETPLEEITDALYNKGIKFLVSHDLKLTLPEFIFNGATLKVSPRALTKTGALVHVDLEPKEEVGEGRLFFHKIKKYIKRKLVMAALAVILVIKLIVLKLVFVLPLIVGVTAAKKLFLKLVLFLFPALSHIFKLCSWYHQNYHTTKYHHHHHLITHHHHKGPHGSQSHSPYGGHHPSSTIVVKPHAEGPPSSFEHYPQDWELSGPGLGNEYVAAGIHRNAIANFKPHPNDVNDINSWGLGLPPGQSMNVGEYVASNNLVPNVVGPNPSLFVNGNKLPTGPSGRPVGPPNPYLQNRNKKQGPKDPLTAEKEALIRAAALAARAPPSPYRDEILRVSSIKLNEANRVQVETDLVKKQQDILASEDPDTIAAEKFYGALLDKVNKLLSTLGALDVGCQERAVCSLYRDPFKHAPYSNLISNELSRSSNELPPAADSKKALRYYDYVEAARNGQEQKDCLVLYPQCNIDYNK